MRTRQSPKVEVREVREASAALRGQNGSHRQHARQSFPTLFTSACLTSVWVNMLVSTMGGAGRRVAPPREG